MTNEIDVWKSMHICQFGQEFGPSVKNFKNSLLVLVDCNIYTECTVIVSFGKFKNNVCKMALKIP